MDIWFLFMNREVYFIIRSHILSFFDGSSILGISSSHIYFLGGSDNKESTCSAGDVAFIPGWGRCPGEGNGNPFQYSCLENSMDRRSWQATVHNVARVEHD